MNIDLGCSNLIRGDIGINYHSYSYLSSNNLHTRQLDELLEKEGFKINHDATYIKNDIELVDYSIYENASYLLAHVLEHINEPFKLLSKLLDSNPNKIIIVVPNCYKNKADRYDKEHKYSWNEYSLFHLLKEVDSFNPIIRKIKVKPIMNNYDLMGIIQ